MKRSLFTTFRTVALIATGIFLSRGAQADTVLDFDIRPAGQNNNVVILQTFGDAASFSSDGVTVTDFGTPNINLTWQATGGRWDYYLDSVWSAGQLDSSAVGDIHELVFTPNHPSAAAVIKSLNFHPYYLSNERYAYDVSVLTNGVTAFGPTNYNFIAESAKVPVSVNYTGSIGQTLTLRLARVSSSPGEGEIEGAGGNIATDDITFAQLPETEFAIGPQVLTVSPANNQSSVAPDYLYVATVTNGATALNPSTIQLRHSSGGLVSHSFVSDSGLSTIRYAATGLLPAGSVNRYTLTFSDNGLPPKSYTNEVQYTVAAYVNIQLPSPLAFESFDSTPEGGLPVGWTATNLDTLRDPTSEPNITVTNLDSAAYTNWTVVEASRFADPFDVYSTFYNGGTPDPTWTIDYQRVLTVNPSNVVNGVFLRNLSTSRLAFGNSGYRNDALGQVLYLSSPDFNLSGKANVHVAFHSLWEQNQDSMAAVEYSIDSGATWLPVVYLLDGPDVFTNLDGTIDALTTFTNVHPTGFQGVATYIEPISGQILGGYYGAFIGVDSNLWSTLAPNIQRRVDDNSLESKRVEIFRLPRADNQPTVRLRFTTVGTDSWYWGVDDVGLYSLADFQITSITRSGANAVVNWINGTPPYQVQVKTNLTDPWSNVGAPTSSTSANVPIDSSTKFIRVFHN